MVLPLSNCFFMKADGTIRNVVSREYPLYFPHPGWSEQKPEDWWNAVVEGIRELVPETGQRESGRHELRRSDARSCHAG